MSVQWLDRTLQGYRIGDPDGDYPIFDATGSTLDPGRWNDAQTAVIYTGEHYSTAMLEKLAHLGGLMPPNQHFVGIEFPKGLTYSRVTQDTLPAWAATDPAASRAFGTHWAMAGESALLIVPSYVARMEAHIVINPRHAQFAKIQYTLPTPIGWDERLFN